MQRALSLVAVVRPNPSGTFRRRAGLLGSRRLFPQTELRVLDDFASVGWMQAFPDLEHFRGLRIHSGPDGPFLFTDAVPKPCDVHFELVSETYPATFLGPGGALNPFLGSLLSDIHLFGKPRGLSPSVGMIVPQGFLEPAGEAVSAVLICIRNHWLQSSRTPQNSQLLTNRNFRL